MNHRSSTSMPPDQSTAAGQFRPSRRAVLGAGLGGAAALCGRTWASAPSAHADAASVVGADHGHHRRGRDPRMRCGRPARDARGLGYLAADVYVDAVAGRTLAGRDSTGRSTGDVLAAAVDYFGG